MKTAIVCEGGGMRGVYTSGVLQAFLDTGLQADLLVGVSAGASNGISYVSGQSGRGFRTNIEYAGDKRYLSFRNYLRTGSLFGMDFIFGTIPESLDPFDYDAFQNASCDYFAGATDVNTGKIVFFGKQDIRPGCIPLRASCSMPVFSPIVEYNGGQYLDGGVADPIPVDKALGEGADRLLVILTRPRAYRKKPQGFRTLFQTVYRQYPAFVSAMQMRHLVYNHTLQRIARLEQQGIATVIAPAQPLPADRFGRDADKLLTSYQQGVVDGLSAVECLNNR